MMLMLRTLTCSVLLGVCSTHLISCSQKGKIEDTKNLLLIAGGDMVKPEDYPAIVEIKSDTTESFQESCTGVFIAPRVMLTAAHCVWQQKGEKEGTSGPLPQLPREQAASRDYFDPGFDDQMEARRRRPNPFADDIREAQNNPGVKSVSFSYRSSSEAENNRVLRSSCYVFPKGYGLEAGRPGSRFDIGLVFFPEPYEINKYLPLKFDSDQLEARVAQTEKTVELFGYGWDAKPFADSHKLRSGVNKIKSSSLGVEEGVIFTFSDPDLNADAAGNQMVRDGDSGGPMLVDGELVGIASALLRNTWQEVCEIGETGQKDCKQKSVDRGYHVDLTFEKTRTYLQKNLQMFADGAIDPKTQKGCTPRNKTEYIKWLQANQDLL